MKSTFRSPLPGLLLLACVLLAACSGRVSQDTLEPEGGYAAATVDTRGLVADVTDVRIEQTPGGAILHAIGLPQTQGYWDVALVRDRSTPQSGDTLRYNFRVRPPVDATGQPIVAPTGSAASREVHAAVFIERSTLVGIRQIVVTGDQSSRSARR